MVPALLTSDTAGGRDTLNQVFAMYGSLPSYRATLDRGGAAGPADVALIGGEEELERGLRRFADAGVTDLVVAAPMQAREAQPTMEWAAAMAKTFA